MFSLTWEKKYLSTLSQSVKGLISIGSSPIVELFFHFIFYFLLSTLSPPNNYKLRPLLGECPLILMKDFSWFVSFFLFVRIHENGNQNFFLRWSLSWNILFNDMMVQDTFFSLYLHSFITVYLAGYQFGGILAIWFGPNKTNIVHTSIHNPAVKFTFKKCTEKSFLSGNVSQPPIL